MNFTYPKHINENGKYFHAQGFLFVKRELRFNASAHISW